MSQIDISSEQLREITLELAKTRLEAADMLSKIAEPELQLLKAHLLIEEVLFALLSYKIKNAASLEKARLSFSQTVCLVEGLYQGEDISASWLFIACHQLNKIRNRLAHKAKPEGIQEEINHFVDFVFSHMKPTFDPQSSLRYVLGSVHANLAAILYVNKKVGLLPTIFRGFSFESQISISKVFANSGTSDAQLFG
jgi:hypothetical protein